MCRGGFACLQITVVKVNAAHLATRLCVIHITVCCVSKAQHISKPSATTASNTSPKQQTCFLCRHIIREAERHSGFCKFFDFCCCICPTTCSASLRRRTTAHPFELPTPPMLRQTSQSSPVSLPPQHRPMLLSKRSKIGRKETCRRLHKVSMSVHTMLAPETCWL